jgi:beta-lactamase class D
VGWFSRSGCRWPPLAKAILASATLAGATHAAEPAPDVGALLAAAGVPPAASTMLVVRLDDGREWSSNPARIDERFVPASTSKIPHTLIALETGYANGPETFFEWDGEPRLFAAWNQDQTLGTAYQRSAIWVYQRIARDLGYETMARWIERLDYGNGDTGGPADLTTYWLEGPLAISAREQVDFLSRLVRDELPLRHNTLVVARTIMRADAGEGLVLYAKTGWGSRDGATDIGWYVGWIETDGPDWAFALNLDMPDEAARARRVPAARAVLAALGAIPAGDGPANAGEIPHDQTTE